MAEDPGGQSTGDGDEGKKPETNDEGKKPESGTKTGPPEGATAEELWDELKRTRSEAASHRIEKSKYKEQLDEIEKAKLSDIDRLQSEKDEADKRAKDAEDRLRQRDVKDSVIDIAKGQKFRDPDDAYRFIKDDLKFDDDGKPTNAETLLTDLAKAKSYLVKGRQSADGGAQDDEPKKNGNEEMNARLRAAAGKGRA